MAEGHNAKAQRAPQGGPGKGMGARPKLEGSPKDILKRLFSIILKDYGIHLVIVLLCIVGSAVASVRGTLFVETLVDDYIMPLMGVENPDFSSLARILISVAGIFAISVICSFTYTRIMVYVSQGTLRKIRKNVFDHMEGLPIKYFDTHAHGDIMSVYTNDTDTLRQFIGQALPQIISSIITIVVTVTSMIILAPSLTAVTLIMIFIMFQSAKFITRMSGKYFRKQQAALGEMNGYIEEMINGQKVVKVFCYEDRAVKSFREMNEELRGSAEKANQFANILMPVNGNMGNLNYVLCAVIGSLMILTGSAGMTVGTLITFLQLAKSATQPIAQVATQINFIVMGMAGAERIFKLMDEELEEDQGYVTLVNANISEDGSISESEEETGYWAWKHFHKEDGTITYVQQQGHIVMEQVDFGYTDDKMVLQDVTLEAQPGEKIAFVGSTGAGKTTITNLINRFYDIQDGKIRYDGININKIRKQDLRRSLGIVLQDTHLFTGTVMDNIRYGKLSATDEECIAAAKLANADGFIRRLEFGYQTMLTGDGSNLSQGQRQLLAIARAAVANPPALILDEATSSIDTRTEQLVQDGMDGLMKGRTTFVIAHRLSTVKNSDCIMVLELGKIIERGNHDKLIENQGKYYQLYTGKL